jgi:FMN phosphatase YigB (HAD superfamily)
MMVKAVLLDLDDTLLGNPPDVFTQRYLAVLDRFLQQRLDGHSVVDDILRCTRDAMISLDPLKTNWDVFYEGLEPALPVDRQTFDASVAEFYETVYPDLYTMIEVRPVARELVEWLLANGFQVVVATNPFFPRVAVEQRLAWAGLPVSEYPFKLVTTLENMHFTKPHPHYYEEILARLGVQADEAIMVGDDWQNDIVPAWCAGLGTFWVAPDGQRPDLSAAAQPDGTGALEDFAGLVREGNWLESLAPREHQPFQIMPRLTGNLAALMGMVNEIPDHVWPMRPDYAEWSPIEVVCHLHESERDVQRPRFELILREDNPFLSQPKPPPAPATRTCPRYGRKVAGWFAEERQQTLNLLGAVEARDWQRPARHYIFGPTNLLEMADFTAQHDRMHFTQLCQTVGKCL